VTTPSDPMSPPVPDATLDLRRDVCPITYVRTKLKLESMAPGAVLEVWLSRDEAVRGVPRSAQEDGHQVLSLEPQVDGSWRLLLQNNRRI
jgi:tRNA 2-thiouridine synthesizing protein A